MRIAYSFPYDFIEQPNMMINEIFSMYSHCIQITGHNSVTSLDPFVRGKAET